MRQWFVGFFSLAIEVLILFTGTTSIVLAAPKSKDGANLYLLAVNVGTHDPKGTPDDWNFATEELKRIVVTQSKPLFRDVKTNLVMGTQATPDGIMKGLEWLQQNAREEDLALFYSGSHGGSDDVRGFCLYANGGTVYGDEIKPALAKVKCHVVVAIQACHAGDLILKHRQDLEAMPKNCAVVCACKAGQTSHGIMLPPIMEALSGWADANNDDVVSVGEFLHYIDYRIGTFYPGKWAESQKAMLAEPKDFDRSRALARTAPDRKFGKHLVMVESKKDWYGGIVVADKESKHKGQRLIHFFDTKNGEEESVENQHICPSDAEPVIVKSGDKWYTAALLKRQGDQFHIRYIGSLNNKEETVGPGRIRAYSLVEGIDHSK